MAMFVFRSHESLAVFEILPDELAPASSKHSIANFIRWVWVSSTTPSMLPLSAYQGKDHANATHLLSHVMYLLRSQPPGGC